MARYLKRLINRLLSESDNADTNDEKGAKLEELTKYLFESIPGVSHYESNALDAPRAHELDVIFTNNTHKSPLLFLDFIIIAECKNTANRLGSHDVRWFIDKLRDRGLSSGILISLNGVTGERDGTSSAHSEVLFALNREKLKILILKREDIISLSDTNDLVRILQQKYMKLTIDRVLQ